MTPQGKIFLHPSGIWVHDVPRLFHGYTVHSTGIVVGKRGRMLRTERRERRGGKYDVCVRLYYNGKSKKWTLQRLIAACFLGNIDGMEIDHLDRDPTNNDINNLEIVTRSENQRRWRKK